MICVMGAQELTIQQARKLCTAFGDLYRVRHEIIWSAFRAGMSRKEIAAKMGMSRQTVSDSISLRKGERDG